MDDNYYERMLYSRTTRGFSLAELLLALLILGSIATFTIPKVITASNNSKKHAIIKESIATLNEVTYLGVITIELQPNTVDSYYTSKINAVKACPNDAVAEGCWLASVPSALASDRTEPGVVMHNGSWIAGFESFSDNIEHITMDWNGATGPNLEGDDQICLRVVFGPNAGDRPGTVVAKPDNPTSVSMFKTIFSQ